MSHTENSERGWAYEAFAQEIDPQAEKAGEFYSHQDAAKEARANGNLELAEHHESEELRLFLDACYEK